MSWSTPSNGGSNHIDGYKINIYKNNILLQTISTSTTKYDYTFSEKNWGDYDVFKFDLCAYSTRWDGVKQYGTIAKSGNYNVETDKYVWVLINSSNASNFVKTDVNILSNSSSASNFKEIKKANFGLNINGKWVSL